MSGRRGPEDRDDDSRSDIQQVVESRKDEAEAAGGDTTSNLEDAGAEDGVGGTAGVVKNQDVAPGSPTGDG